MAKTESEKWTEVRSVFWKPENEGECLIGVFAGIEKTNYGEAIKVQTDDGAFLMNYTALNRMFGNIEEGTRVKIEYLGTRTSKKGQEYKDFRIYTA